MPCNSERRKQLLGACSLRLPFAVFYLSPKSVCTAVFQYYRFESSVGIPDTTGLRGRFSTGPASFGVGSLPQGDHKGTDWCFSGGYLQCWLPMQGSREVLNHCSDTCRPRLDDAVLIRGLNFLMSPRVPRGWVLATCVSPQEMLRHSIPILEQSHQT